MLLSAAPPVVCFTAELKLTARVSVVVAAQAGFCKGCVCGGGSVTPTFEVDASALVGVSVGLAKIGLRGPSDPLCLLLPLSLPLSLSPSFFLFSISASPTHVVCCFCYQCTGTLTLLRLGLPFWGQMATSRAVLVKKEASDGVKQRGCVGIDLQASAFDGKISAVVDVVGSLLVCPHRTSTTGKEDSTSL